MDLDDFPPLGGPSSSPPLPPTKDPSTSNLPTIKSSNWNVKNTLPSSSHSKPSNSKGKGIAQDTELSSDPISAALSAGENFFTPPHFNIKKRTANTTTLPSSQTTKYLRMPTSSSSQASKSPKEAVLAARDLLVEAYTLTTDRLEQNKLLNLLEVFRNYTETGRIDPSLAPSNNPTSSPSYSEKLKAGLQHQTQESKSRAATGSKKATNIQPNNIVPKNSTSQKQLEAKQRAGNIITLVAIRGSNLPDYNAISIRDEFNKAMGKKAISRVHTSMRNNLVLTCFESNPTELLENEQKWKYIFQDWPIDQAQRVNLWPKLIVHGVPAALDISSFQGEVEQYNTSIKVNGQPRWLAGTPTSKASSVVFSVASDEEKSRLLKSGILIGGMLLKVVNYRPYTPKTQCKKCLGYGHDPIFCKKAPLCAICSGSHLTTEHSCGRCNASDFCPHYSKQCVNCRGTDHAAFERQDCEIYKALTC